MPSLRRNVRSSGVSVVGFEFGKPAGDSRQQSDNDFTMQTFLRHRGQRHSITRACAEERPTADMCFGTPPQPQTNGNFRYSMLSALLFYRLSISPLHGLFLRPQGFSSMAAPPAM